MSLSSPLDASRCTARLDVTTSPPGLPGARPRGAGPRALAAASGRFVKTQKCWDVACSPLHAPRIACDREERAHACSRTAWPARRNTAMQATGSTEQMRPHTHDACEQARHGPSINEQGELHHDGTREHAAACGRKKEEYMTEAVGEIRLMNAFRRIYPCLVKGRSVVSCY